MEVVRLNLYQNRIGFKKDRGRFGSEFAEQKRESIEITTIILILLFDSVFHVQGVLDKETGEITCTLEYWGKSEEVEVTVILDGQNHPSSLKVLFYNPHKLIDPPKMIKLNFAVASDTTINDLELHLDTLESILGDANSEMTVTCIFITRTG